MSPRHLGPTGSACSACSTARARRTPSAASPRPSANRCRSWSSRGGYPRAHRRTCRPTSTPRCNCQHVTKCGRAGDQRPAQIAERHAPRLHAAAQRPRRARCWSRCPATSATEEVPEPLELQAGASRPAYGARPARRSPRPRKVLIGGQAAGDLRRPGRALRRGLAAAARSWPSCWQAPVTHQPRGQERLPGDPSAVARLRRPRRCRKPVQPASSTSADVIFGIGCRFTETNFGIAMPQGQDASSTPRSTRRDINKDVPVEHALVGDAKLTLDALHRGAASAWAASRAAARAAVAAEIKPHRKTSGWRSGCRKLTSDEAPLTPYRVIWDLLHTVDVANTIITHDAGSPRDQLSPFWQTTDAAHLHRLGQDHAARLRPRPRDGRQARAARTSSASTSGATPPSASPAWTSRRRCASASRSCRSCSTTSRWRSSSTMMKVSTEKYRSTDISGNYADIAQRLRRLRRARDRARARSSRRSSAASRRPQKGTPALLEFITSKEVTISVPK